MYLQLFFKWHFKFIWANRDAKKCFDLEGVTWSREQNIELGTESLQTNAHVLDSLSMTSHKPHNRKHRRWFQCCAAVAKWTMEFVANCSLLASSKTLSSLVISHKKFHYFFFFCTTCRRLAISGKSKNSVKAAAIWGHRTYSFRLAQNHSKSWHRIYSNHSQSSRFHSNQLHTFFCLLPALHSFAH